MVFENIKEDDLERYRKKLLMMGVIFSITVLSVMVLLFVSLHVYGGDNIITKVISYLMGISALGLLGFVISIRLVEAKLSRFGCLGIGACQENRCKYPWSSCIIVAKFNYIICKNFVHDITEKVGEFIEYSKII